MCVFFFFLFFLFFFFRSRITFPKGAFGGIICLKSLCIQIIRYSRHLYPVSTFCIDFGHFIQTDKTLIERKAMIRNQNNYQTPLV